MALTLKPCCLITGKQRICLNLLANAVHIPHHLPVHFVKANTTTSGCHKDIDMTTKNIFVEDAHSISVDFIVERRMSKHEPPE